MMVDDAGFREALNLLFLARNPARVSILLALREGEMENATLGTLMPGWLPKTIYDHAARLRTGGLIETRRVGHVAVFSLTTRGRMLAEALAEL